MILLEEAFKKSVVHLYVFGSEIFLPKGGWEDVKDVEIEELKGSGCGVRSKTMEGYDELW